MANFYETVLTVLKSDERFVAEDGTFLRNAVYEAAMKMDEGLIRLLLANDETRTRFFAEVDGVKVFDKMGFAWVINNRQFLPDSYTRFKNKIGLIDENGESLSVSGNVSLVFPYRDCILEGGQTKEDQSREEVFYNETLAPDEVDRLLFPKALKGATRFTVSGKEEIVEFTDEDNLIIKGNNLLAIASLLKRFEGKIKTVTLTKETDGSYYVSILVEDEDKAPAVIQQTVNDEGDVLGIDMGVKELCTCSDGTVFENNRYLPKSEKKLKREQKRLSRKKKGSANRNKQRIKVAKVHKKIADQRKDTIEKVTAEIAGKSHAAVAVETLSVKGMVRNHHLAKSVSDASISAFLTRLETKCRNNGKVFVKVDRWFASSQTCSVCGYVNKEIKDLKIREWECPRCHTMHMRDANASLNIAREGYRLIARLPMDGGGSNACGEDSSAAEQSSFCCN